MKQHSGWYLPDTDNYFEPFLSEEMGEMNGFQLDHLHEALKYVTRFGTAVEAGAHCGFWTRTLARRFTQIYSFEPSPDTFRCLEMNINEDNVILYQAAVGDKPGSCTVCEDDKRLNNTGSRFVQPDGEIPMVSIDSLDLNACDFLKIDVEGFEYQVVVGAIETLKAHKPVVIMETDKKFSVRRYGIGHNEAENFLLNLGYRKVAHMRPDTVFVC